MFIPLNFNEESWRFISDRVMGGHSSGSIITAMTNPAAMQLRGHVSTRNNGGFIQAAINLSRDQAKRAVECDGVRLTVLGNGHGYNVHLRTHDLLLPWQSYRAGFPTTSSWQTIDLPFESFTPYRTSASLDLARLHRIGIVAIGEEFEADVSISDIGFYRD